jgi:proton glutamate symport protein
MSQEASNRLARNIGISMFLGLVVGFGLYFAGYASWSEYVAPVGTVFIRGLKMVIIPLVFSSVYMAVFNLGDPQHLTSIGKKAIIYYTVTTSIAVFIGLVLVTTFKPGVNAQIKAPETKVETSMKAGNEPVQKEKPRGLISTIVEVGVNSIPTNPIEAMANNSMLQVIVFAIMLGLVGLFHQEEASGFTAFALSLERMSQHLTHWVMKIAPFGIFALLVNVVANSGIDALITLSKYMGIVVLGLFIHSTLLLLLGAWSMKRKPLYILKNMSSALFTAFSTSSSAATLPITMSCLIENLKVSEKTANFVLPLGATINMDGTALYVSVATVFIAQVYGIDLSFAQLTIIFVTASLAAVGAAAIPSAGLITMGIVLGAVGIPLEGIQMVIAVDRILDMFRTATNVLGDSSGSILVDSLLKREDAKAMASA